MLNYRAIWKKLNATFGMLNIQIGGFIEKLIFVT